MRNLSFTHIKSIPLGITSRVTVLAATTETPEESEREEENSSMQARFPVDLIQVIINYRKQTIRLYILANYTIRMINPVFVRTTIKIFLFKDRRNSLGYL